MLQPAHTTPPRVTTTHTRGSLHGRPGSRLMESAGRGSGASLVPAPPLGALTLGVLPAGGIATRGFRPGCPGYGRLGDQEGTPRGKSRLRGSEACFPTPPSSARPTARLDEPPTPPHGPPALTFPFQKHLCPQVRPGELTVSASMLNFSSCFLYPVFSPRNRINYMRISNPNDCSRADAQ